MKYMPPINGDYNGYGDRYVESAPSQGILRSVPPVSVYEQVQKEIENVIKKAGLDPNKDDLEQLYKAIDALFKNDAVDVNPTMGGTVTLTKTDLPTWCQTYEFYPVIYGRVSTNGSTYSTEYYDSSLFNMFYQLSITQGTNCKLILTDTRTSKFIADYRLNEYVNEDTNARWFKYPIKYKILLLKHNPTV